MKTKSLIILFALLSILLLSSCGSDKKELAKLQKDVEETKRLVEDTACRQCEAMNCEACKSAPVCRGKCGGCDKQCGTATPPPTDQNITDPPGVGNNTSNSSG